MDGLFVCVDFLPGSAAAVSAFGRKMFVFQREGETDTIVVGGEGEGKDGGQKEKEEGEGVQN